VIDWVMLAERVSVRHALELLCRDYLPSAVSATEPPPKQSTVPKLPPLCQHYIQNELQEDQSGATIEKAYTTAET
jgi:hypothetical protein